VGLLAVATPAALPCDNPFFRLINAQDWKFAYRAFAALDAVENHVCPAYSNAVTCCDNVVYDALAVGWLKLYGEVVSISVRLDVLQFQVNLLLTEIGIVKNDVSQSTKLTAQEKTAIINFLNAVASAVSQLVPSIRANFVQCYSAVLKFYAGLLCRSCNTTWNDWVVLNGSDPNNDQFQLNFANKTCHAFQAACTPFFQPFFTFADALFTAAEQLAGQIRDNTTRQDVLNALEAFEPPCLNHNDCLLFICFRFLVGLERLEDWAFNSFSNTTTSGGNVGTREEPFITDRAVRALNNVQRSTTGVWKAFRGATPPLTGQTYTGTFDPLSESSTLNTDAGTSSASAIQSWLVNMILTQ